MIKLRVFIILSLWWLNKIIARYIYLFVWSLVTDNPDIGENIE